MARLQVLERAGKHPSKNLKCGGLTASWSLLLVKERCHFPWKRKAAKRYNLISMQAETLLKLRIVIQTFAFMEAAAMILCTALEGDLSLFSTVPSHFEDGTALPKQQGGKGRILSCL